jgi:hypothetical protein
MNPFFSENKENISPLDNKQKYISNDGNNEDGMNVEWLKMELEKSPYKTPSKKENFNLYRTRSFSGTDFRTNKKRTLNEVSNQLNNNLNNKRKEENNSIIINNISNTTIPMDIVINHNNNENNWNNLYKTNSFNELSFYFNDSTDNHILPTVKNTNTGGLNFISYKTLIEIIEGKYKKNFDKVFIIDSRYDYEYNGGHIIDAINIPKVEDLHELFFRQPIVNAKVVIVFYCEFSSHRGPSGYFCIDFFKFFHNLRAKYIRNIDRKLNEYPKLYYNDLYILEGGYKNFFQNCKNFCYPPNYVGMKDKNYCELMKEFQKKNKI